MEYEDDYEYEVTVLRMRFRLAGENFRSARDHYFKLVLQGEGRYYLAKHVPKVLFFFVVCTRTGGSVGWASGYYAGGREDDSGS